MNKQRLRGSGRYQESLRVLCGGKVPEKVPPLLDLIATCLAEPLIFPELVEDIVTDKGIKEARIHLARVQIDSELRMRQDVDYHTQRLWMAQTIERMVFGGLMIEGEKVTGGENEDDG
ncbi:MAG: hypothetical protein JW939_02945 [Candidatus Thermoplasmatota archaeon]|nr:hypothetical protein [Candidatus Thermoplasmatota archaeon]